MSKDEPSGSSSKTKEPEAQSASESSASHVLTRAQRDALTPRDVYNRLKAGNDRFARNLSTSRDAARQVRDAARGQSPMAVILSCLDSRIPVEDVFDQGIGDVFVGRVAGNFENTELLGSMEFACLSQDPEVGGGGAKLVFVLGHQDCGAIKHGIDRTEAGNITEMLRKIQQAVERTEYDGERTSTNPEFVNRVAEKNVRLTMDRIRQNSDILRGMEADGQIAIVGGVYQMATGKVRFFDGD